MQRFTVLLMIVCGVFVSLAHADSFPTAPQDQTLPSAFGNSHVFYQVLPEYRPLVASAIAAGGLSGYTYDATTGVLSSPGLYDPAVTIGYSAALTEGSFADGNGVTVGVTDPKIIFDGNFSKVPAGFEGPAGTREVHAAITTLNLSDTSGNNFRAGTAAPDQQFSPGEFESNDPTGNAANDYPAKGFFNVFADMDLQFGGTSGKATVYNNSPFVFQYSAVTDLSLYYPIPLQFLSNGVPVYFNSDNSPNWFKGDQFAVAYVGGPFVNSLPEPACIAWSLLVVLPVLRPRREASAFN